MSEGASDQQQGSDQQGSDQQGSDQQASNPQGGISETGRTAGDFSPESQVPGDDYGNTGAETTAEMDAEDTVDDR